MNTLFFIASIGIALWTGISIGKAIYKAKIVAYYKEEMEPEADRTIEEGRKHIEENKSATVEQLIEAAELQGKFKMLDIIINL